MTPTYCSAQDLQAFSLGLDTSVLGNSADQLLEFCTALVDAETGMGWFVDEATEAVETVYESNLDTQPQERGFIKVCPTRLPIRNVTSISVMPIGSYEPQPSVQSVPVTPVVSMGGLPVQFGSVRLNRKREALTITNDSLYPLFDCALLDKALVSVTYTHGYDVPGVASADGLTLPIPSWLREATRLWAASILADWGINAELSGVSMISMGQTQMRFRDIPKGPPPNVSILLQGHHYDNASVQP